MPKLTRRNPKRPSEPADVVRPLEPVLQAKGSLQTEYRKRSSPFVFKKIHPADVDQFTADGWIVAKRGKRNIRVKKEKSLDAKLEDRAWCFFYRMGYPEIGGAKFRVTYERADGSKGTKQIDLFAKDDETVIIGECKASETRGKRSLQKDLHETESLQKPVANTIRAFYGRQFKPKIIWFYITQNIIWSDPDLDRAQAINIRVVTENQFNYFEAFINHIGPGGRYQFLAEFLQGQSIPGLSNNRVPATRGKLGEHTFYSFVTTPLNLLKISFVNHLALDHPDGRPAYQRMIERARIKAIGNFIRKGGYFPTNIVINFTEKCRFDLISPKDNSDPNIKFGWLYLPNKYKSAWIIDGQHRLYGFSHLDDEQVKNSVIVVAFEKMDVTTEADLFITVNHKQKRVPKSILLALQSDLKWGSPDSRERVVALASRLVRNLSTDPTSPFFQRVVAQGVNPAANQNLTVPELVNGLVRASLLGRPLKSYALGYLSDATDDGTLDRARKILNAYFGSVRDSNPSRWEAGKAGFVAINAGVRGHLLLIAEILQYVQSKVTGFDALAATEDEIIGHLRRVATPVLQFIKSTPDAGIQQKFAGWYGEGGVKSYFFALCEIINANSPDFGSSDFVAHMQGRADARVAEANNHVHDLEKYIRDYVIFGLKQIHGEKETRSSEKAYWEVGIESPKIKEDAYKAHLQTPIDHRAPKEAYITLLDCMKIVKQENNWAYFKPVFNIQMPSEKGKAYYLDWMEKLNELRRIAAHRTSLKTYTEEDYMFLAAHKNEFCGRLERAGYSV